MTANLWIEWKDGRLENNESLSESAAVQAFEELDDAKVKGAWINVYGDEDEDTPRQVNLK